MRYSHLDSLHQGPEPTWLVVYATVDNSIENILDQLHSRWPRIPIIGCTSFHGVFTPEGFKRGVFVLAGDASDGVQMVSRAVPLGEDVRDSAQRLALELKQQAANPSVMLVHATPGAEEAVIAGLDDAFGGKLPIFGGSAADDDLTGQWRVFDHTSLHGKGLAVAAFSSPRKVHGELLGGYLPTGKKGVVTRASGRVVYEIDGRPAAEVYNDWSNGAIAAALGSGAAILGETSFYPLGRVIKKVLGIPIWLLSHPAFVHAPDNGLVLFADVAEGETLTLMRGSTDSLVQRAGLVVAQASMQRNTPDPLRGGILIYCGGCVGAIESHIGRVVDEFNAAMRGAPYLGVATFGEQGQARGTGSNRHGNLMCDVILFD